MDSQTHTLLARTAIALWLTLRAAALMLVDFRDDRPIPRSHPMRQTELPADETAELTIGAFHARIAAIQAGGPTTFQADVAIQRRDDDGGTWEQVRAARMTVKFPTVTTLDMLVDSLLDLYESADFHVRVTAAVMDADGRVKISYGTIGPTWNTWPLTPDSNAL